MALFKRLSDVEIALNYTHTGLLFGWVPVYCTPLANNTADIKARNWVPEPLVYLSFAIFGAFCGFTRLLIPGWNPDGFPLKITGKIMVMDHEGNIFPASEAIEKLREKLEKESPQ